MGADQDRDSDEWEDLDEDEAEEMLARVIPQDTCLFCTKKSQNMKLNINHMNLVHGFFIPEDKYLINRDGLLEYLGFKVGAGLTCLWCNKQYKDLHGVRLHMVYKDHCKIMYDQDKAQEYSEFYDYSSQEVIPMKPLNELAIPRKRLERRNERALVRATRSSSKQIVAAQQKNPLVIAGTFQSKNINKFNAKRAKAILRVGMTNNKAMMGRFRNQNPM